MFIYDKAFYLKSVLQFLAIYVVIFELCQKVCWSRKFNILFIFNIHAMLKKKKEICMEVKAL